MYPTNFLEFLIPGLSDIYSLTPEILIWPNVYSVLIN